MQVDSAPPFTSVAQSMNQTAAPPRDATPGDDSGAAGSSSPVSAATPSGVGGAVDLTV